jgi:UDP-N-acetyl-D-galactosamine dehydrogenase
MTRNSDVTHTDRHAVSEHASAGRIGGIDPATDAADATESTPEQPGADTVCVVGLGYVGLPLAVAFDRAGRDVVGYDVDAEKVAALDDGRDPTGEVGADEVAASEVAFTAGPGAIERADYVVVTVPTPVDDRENPNLEFVESAGETVGAHLAPGTTVVLESTVYPGATEGVLAPALEAESGLVAGEDFHLGYSPERASPGDAGRGVGDVVKIVGANTDSVRDDLADLYGSVVDAGIYRAPDIETAEAAKVIENVQRDLNIALVNELAMACEHMDLSTEAVLEAAGTKWNFHDEYEPGLVGGHCIPVDPHYLAHRSEREGFSPKLVLQAREINEYVPTHTARLAVKALNACGKVPAESRLLLLGLSYKPNVGDIRTSEVSGVIAELEEFDVDVTGYDPHADDEAMREAFGVEIQDRLDPAGFDGAVVATGHDELQGLDLAALAGAMAADPILVDVPGAVDAEEATEHGFAYRQL